MSHISHLKSQISYRNATIADLPAIVAIYNSTVASRLVTADTEPVSTDSKLKWFHEHTPDHRPLWVIEDEQKNRLGWASFQSFYGRPAYNHTCELSIYLHEDARGKGLGKQVLQYCMDNAPKYDIKTLLGFIFAHNEPSMKLFHQLGFEDWANFPNIAVLDGVERSLIIVGKRVG